MHLYHISFSKISNTVPFKMHSNLSSAITLCGRVRVIPLVITVKGDYDGSSVKRIFTHILIKNNLKNSDGVRKG